MLGHRKLEAAEYLGILKRRRVLILCGVLIFPILGAAITFVIPPKYMSQTLVLIEEQKVPDEYVKPVIATNLDSRLASMKEQILSRSRVQPIIERYNLYGKERLNMDDRVDAARKAIDIKPIRSAISGTGGMPGFFITFTASDAHTAQLVCSEITNLFMNENARSREASAEGTTDFLKGQLADAKRTLDEQDAKLAAFQKQYFGKLPSEENGNMNMLNSLSSQLDAVTQAIQHLEQEKTYQQSMLAQQEGSLGIVSSLPLAAGASPAPSAAATVLGTDEQRKELNQLQKRDADLAGQYTPNHPDVVAVRRQIADLKKQMVQESAAGGVTAEGRPQRNPMPQETVQIQQLRALGRVNDQAIADKKREQAQIQGRLGMYQSRIQSSPEVEEQYKDVTRDYTTAQKFYDDLLVKMEHSKMATDLERRQEGEQFRVMDESNLPDSPSFPKLWMFALGGLALGLAISLGIAAFLEYKDTSLRNEQDVWAFTRLPTLGIISIAGDILDEAPKKPGFLARFRRNRTIKTDAEALAGANG